MEPNRNDSKNRNNNSGDNKRPKGSIWITLIITVAMILGVVLAALVVTFLVLLATFVLRMMG